MKAKSKFSGRGKAILAGTKPTGISDFLATDETVNTYLHKEAMDKTSSKGDADLRINVYTETSKYDNTENRENVNTSKLIDNKKDLRTNSVTGIRKAVEAYQRVELKLPIDLAERLRAYAFHSRTTKTATISRALIELFEKEQFIA